MNRNANVLQMQQAAAARVKAMEENSRRLVREHPVNIYRGVTFAPPKPLCAAKPEPTPPCETVSEVPCCEQPAELVSVRECGETALATPKENGEEERILVLLLAVVLLKNGAPLPLVLALLYIAL